MIFYASNLLYNLVQNIICVLSTQGIMRNLLLCSITKSSRSLDWTGQLDRRSWSTRTILRPSGHDPTLLRLPKKKVGIKSVTDIPRKQTSIQLCVQSLSKNRQWGPALKIERNPPQGIYAQPDQSKSKSKIYPTRVSHLCMNWHRMSYTRDTFESIFKRF